MFSPVLNGKEARMWINSGITEKVNHLDHLVIQRSQLPPNPNYNFYSTMSRHNAPVIILCEKTQSHYPG